MLEEEIVVAPLLVFRIDLIAEGGERCLAGGVEVAHILVIAVIGRHVHAAAKPPDILFAFLAGDEAAHVHVGCRAVGVLRVQDQRHPHRFPGAASELRAHSGCGGWQRFTGDVRKIDSAALEEVALLNQA